MENEPAPSVPAPAGGCGRSRRTCGLPGDRVWTAVPADGRPGGLQPPVRSGPRPVPGPSGPVEPVPCADRRSPPAPGGPSRRRPGSRGPGSAAPAPAGAGRPPAGRRRGPGAGTAAGPVRPRRSAGVQWPYAVRSCSCAAGRDARAGPAGRPSRAASAPSRVGDPLGVVHDQGERCPLARAAGHRRTEPGRRDPAGHAGARCRAERRPPVATTRTPAAARPRRGRAARRSGRCGRARRRAAPRRRAARARASRGRVSATPTGRVHAPSRCGSGRPDRGRRARRRPAAGRPRPAPRAAGQAAATASISAWSGRPTWPSRRSGSRSARPATGRAARPARDRPPPPPAGRRAGTPSADAVTAVSGAGTAPGRSAVRATAIPSSGPSAHSRGSWSCSASPSGSSCAARSARRLSTSSTMWAAVAPPGCPPPGQLGAQPAQQAGLALAVVGRHHRAGVRQRPEGGQAADAEVERVERERGRGQRCAHERERRPPAAPWSCRCPVPPSSSRPPAVGSQPTGALAPGAAGSSARATTAGRRAGGARGRAARQRQHGRQRLGPGPARGRGCRSWAATHGVDQALQVARAGPPRRAGCPGAAAARDPGRLGGGGPGPVTSAVCSGTTSPGPSRTYARPGRSRPIRAASATPMTSVESAASCTRSAIRRLVLARMSSLDHAGRALGGEQQVHAEAAAALGDADQGGQEVGQLGGQRRELVDDHDQARAAARAGRARGRRAGRRRRRAQHAARGGAARRRGAQRPLAELLVEVGHQPDDVRQPGAGVEGGAALVVDEHEGEVLRAGVHARGRRRGCAAARSCPRRWCRRRARGDRRGRGRCRTAVLGDPERACGLGSAPAASQRARTAAAVDRAVRALDAEQRQQADARRAARRRTAQLGVGHPGQVAGAAPRRGRADSPATRTPGSRVPPRAGAARRCRRPRRRSTWSQLAGSASVSATSDQATRLAGQQVARGARPGRPRARRRPAGAGVHATAPPPKPSATTARRHRPARPPAGPRCAAASGPRPSRPPAPGSRRPPRRGRPGRRRPRPRRAGPRAAASAASRSPTSPARRPPDRSTGTGAATSRAAARSSGAAGRRPGGSTGGRHGACPHDSRRAVEQVAAVRAAAPTAGCSAARPGGAPRPGRAGRAQPGPLRRSRTAPGPRRARPGRGEPVALGAVGPPRAAPGLHQVPTVSTGLSALNSANAGRG